MHFDSARQSTIEAQQSERGRPFLFRKADEKYICEDVYRNNLKNRNSDKEASQNFDLERMTIVRAQGMSEGQNFEIEPTLSKADSSSCFGISVHNTIHGQMRLSMLKRCDQFLDIISSKKLKYYSLTSESQHFINNVPALVSFADDFGYFSPVHPIIAHVSNQQEDLALVLSILTDLLITKNDQAFVSFAIAEMCAKVLAYRDLNLGQRMQLPVKNESAFYLTEFTVDHVFDLWNGMPAYGLIPDKKGIPSLLLFRGTDFALYSKRGWASLLSDVDGAGPGFSVFMKARSEIHEWLEKSASENKKAIVLGFSLGGSLAAYTYLYEGDLLNETGSAAFNAPGISEETLKQWNNPSRKKRAGFVSYINEGDIISKKGCLFGPAYALSTEVLMKPLFAHTVLISGQPSFTMTAIDVAQENAQR